MIVEIGGGHSGIAEYLEKGLKQGRLLSRDELDQRIILSGDLELTDTIINSIEDKGQERYLHITLSFREDEISHDLLSEITSEYQSLLMNAYSDDEYHFYAEAHLPKVKSIKDYKSGEMIERKPHIHIVIPERNLLTGNKLLPTGYADNVNIKNIPYLDAIQEHINYKYNLESPKDFMRSGGHHSANVLSRIKGDFFGQKQSQFKTRLVDEIAGGNINSIDSFKRRLTDFGEVKIRNRGKSNQYFAVKLAGDKKFTNLNHPVFSEQVIKTKSLPKPDKALIHARLEEWRNRVSKEIKFVDFATPSFRQKYAQADVGEKQRLLQERELDYDRKYRQSHAFSTTRGRARNSLTDLANVDRTQSRTLTGTAVGLSGMPSGNLVRSAPQRGAGTQGILPENEFHHLRDGKPRIDSALRRNDSSRGGSHASRGRGVKAIPANPRSFAELPSGIPQQRFQRNLLAKGRERNATRSHTVMHEITPYERYLAQNGQQGKARYRNANVISGFAERAANDSAKQADLAKFAMIRRDIDADYFLGHLAKIYAIDPQKYRLSYASDGSPRFNVGKRNLNASDLLTKHLNLSWSEAKNVLEFCYAHQHNKNVNQERRTQADIKRNIKAFDSEVRQFEKQAKSILRDMEIDNRNAFRLEKKRIYSRPHLDIKIRNQELAIASFRCMQRQELIDDFAQHATELVRESRAYFRQNDFQSLKFEDIAMATLQDLQQNAANTISAAEPEKTAEKVADGEKKGFFEAIFNRIRQQTPLEQEKSTTQQQAKNIYATQSGEELNPQYRGNVTFKNLALQESLKKNNIGVSKHTDGQIDYKSLADGKLICRDDGEKMRIQKENMSPENVKFFLEVSIDRYGNELKINGSKEFKEMVVEAAAANNLPVILQPAALQEQLMKRREELQLESKGSDNSVQAANEQTQSKGEPSATIEPTQAQAKDAAVEQQSTPMAARHDTPQEAMQAQAAEGLKDKSSSIPHVAAGTVDIKVINEETLGVKGSFTDTEAQNKVSESTYKIEFKYDDSAKQHAKETPQSEVGRFYSVRVNDQPVKEAMKADPNLSKVLDNVAKVTKDLQNKGITADILKSGHVFAKQNQIGGFNKPESIKVNGLGQSLQTSKSAAKAKSNDMAL